MLVPSLVLLEVKFWVSLLVKQAHGHSCVSVGGERIWGRAGILKKTDPNARHHISLLLRQRKDDLGWIWGLAHQWAAMEFKESHICLKELHFPLVVLAWNFLLHRFLENSQDSCSLHQGPLPRYLVWDNLVWDSLNRFWHQFPSVCGGFSHQHPILGTPAGCPAIHLKSNSIHLEILSTVLGPGTKMSINCFQRLRAQPHRSSHHPSIPNPGCHQCCW